MIMPDEQVTKIYEFMDYVFNDDKKESLISLLVYNNSNEYITLDQCKDIEEYYDLISTRALMSDYTIMYIPDNTLGYIRIFFKFLDPSSMKYTTWIIIDGSLQLILIDKNKGE